MNPKVLGVLQLLWILFVFVDPGICLECYTCSAQLGMQNYNQQDCQYFWNSYDSNNHRRTQCHHSNAVCAKYIVNHEGMVWVHRSCQPPDICSYLHARYSNPRSQLLECYTCEGNLCNGAARLLPGGPSVGVAALCWVAAGAAALALCRRL